LPWRRLALATPCLGDALPWRRFLLTTLALGVSSSRQRLVLTLTPGIDFDLDLVNARIRDGTILIGDLVLEGEGFVEVCGVDSWEGLSCFEN